MSIKSRGQDPPVLNRRQVSALLQSPSRPAVYLFLLPPQIGKGDFIVAFSSSPRQRGMMDNALLQFQHVTLVRGLQVVVQDLNFSLSPGQIFAVKGENGAGKTSLLRAAAHLLTPFSGNILWGHTCQARFLGHELAIKYDQKPADFLDSDRLIAWSLTELASVPIAFLSAGQRKRVALAHRCRPGANLWLMDEPFANLDAAQSNHLRQMIADHAAAGGAALCSIHGDELPGPLLHVSGGRAHVV